MAEHYYHNMRLILLIFSFLFFCFYQMVKRLEEYSRFLGVGRTHRGNRPQISARDKFGDVWRTVSPKRDKNDTFQTWVHEIRARKGGKGVWVVGGGGTLKKMKK